MGVIAWDPKYATGHKLVDAQHQALFQMVNDLHEAIVGGQGKTEMLGTLEKLAKYVVEHFRTEEGFMLSLKYPGIDEHKRKHRELTDKATEIINSYRNGKLVLTITLSQFLSDWIRHHIQEEDIALVNWLNSRKAAA